MSKEIDSVFEIIGYTKEFYVPHLGGSKFIGYMRVDETDRNTFGYAGRKKEILEEDVVFTNKRKLKKGTEVITEIIPLMGKSRVGFFGAKKQQDEE